MELAMKKQVSALLIAGLALVGMLGVYVFQKMKVYLSYSSQKQAASLFPSICSVQERTSANPRPALFIGCGIFE
ncbi:MAG: hypothetical protein UX06_C0032G0024 [Candidatus Giovannonibacteria bacterium GW2011_GWA2_45_21]|uniref:Uncharacterized protein n=1 Tax=Candidatus Giovannonibacteria bacterium GW2011_GWA2_45_21 TaxID=1618649 RepID=A0A0G1M6G6_9BACT|nr:MAG: hypothetical protein UX06_C0032G0024 [Candidatus Giovannonibacteria bacterium GW2011_GWA2_45_21]